MYSFFSFKILSKCRFHIFQLVVSGLILVLIWQPILNLFRFLTKVQLAYVLLVVDETFYSCYNGLSRLFNKEIKLLGKKINPLSLVHKIRF